MAVLLPDKQNLHIRDTFLGTGFEQVSLFSGATESQRMLSTVWGGGTHTYKTFAVWPRYNSCANQAGCGKSVHMEIVTAMSANPLTVDYSSPAGVYGWLDEHPDTTLGLDEADKIFGIAGRNSNNILAAIINAGYIRKGKVLVQRSGHSVLMYVFSPIAIAGIGRLPNDTLERCLVIHLQKKMPEEMYISMLHEDDLAFAGQEIGAYLARPEIQEALESAPKLADIKGDPRERFIMAPLAAICKVAGCHDQFLEAMHEIQTGIAANPPRPVL